MNKHTFLWIFPYNSKKHIILEYRYNFRSSYPYHHTKIFISLLQYFWMVFYLHILFWWLCFLEINIIHLTLAVAFPLSLTHSHQMFQCFFPIQICISVFLISSLCFSCLSFFWPLPLFYLFLLLLTLLLLLLRPPPSFFNLFPLIAYSVTPTFGPLPVFIYFLLLLTLWPLPLFYLFPLIAYSVAFFWPLPLFYLFPLIAYYVLPSFGLSHFFIYFLLLLTMSCLLLASPTFLSISSYCLLCLAFFWPLPLFYLFPLIA